MRTTSRATDKIIPALFAARRKFVKVKKDKVNGGAGKAKYATLDSVLDTITTPLDSEDIIIEQSMTDDSSRDTIKVSTTLTHISGQWISYLLVMPVAKSDPQGMGSAFTYARRYALAAALGLSQADDDAQLAVVSARDWNKRLDKCSDLESLADMLKKAWSMASPADKPVIQEHYEKRKAALSIASVVDDKKGFAPAKIAKKNNASAVNSEPVKSEVKPENIESFD